MQGTIVIPGRPFLASRCMLRSLTDGDDLGRKLSLFQLKVRCTLLECARNLCEFCRLAQDASVLDVSSFRGQAVSLLSNWAVRSSCDAVDASSSFQALRALLETPDVLSADEINRVGRWFDVSYYHLCLFLRQFSAGVLDADRRHAAIRSLQHASDLVVDEIKSALCSRFARVLGSLL